MNKSNKEGKQDGYWESYYSTGNFASKGNYINGKRDGYWEFYNIDGNLYYKGNYINGKQDGYWVRNYRSSPHQLYLNI